MRGCPIVIKTYMQRLSKNPTAGYSEIWSFPKGGQRKKQFHRSIILRKLFSSPKNKTTSLTLQIKNAVDKTWPRSYGKSVLEVKESDFFQLLGVTEFLGTSGWLRNLEDPSRWNFCLSILLSPILNREFDSWYVALVWATTTAKLQLKTFGRLWPIFEQCFSRHWYI